MRLFVRNPSPSVIKVQVFVDESGHSLDEVEVADTRSPAFLKINPFGTVPVLETDSGEMLSESLTICRFLESRWNCGLFGDSRESQVQVELWERRAELLLYLPAIDYVHRIHPKSANGSTQHVEWANVLVGRTQAALKGFNRQLEHFGFLAGDRFSMADITAFLGVSGFAGSGVLDLSSLAGLSRWFETVGARPSMRRLRALSL